MDLADRMFYAFIPSIGNLLVVISAITMFVLAVEC